MCAKTLQRTSEWVARNKKLKEVYAVFANLQKGSEEYERLASSGMAWEGYFQPGDSRRMGYVDLQREFKSHLESIDELRGRLPILELARELVPRYAQQSVMIENNPLKVADAVRIFEQLKLGQRFGPVGMLSMPSSALPALARPDGSSSATVELRNHIIASQWIADNATARSGTAGITENETRDLAALSVKGTASEAVYDMSWGGRVPLGGYRKLPIQVRSNALFVCPYPQEVPACVRRFFAWRDAQHGERRQLLHPLMLAVQMAAYFVHVHPFPDGNGRVSRMVMQDYMARQGYLPAILRPEGELERGDYIRMIDGACEGRPREFVAAVLEAQLALLSGHLGRKSADGHA